jgi:hypothetical protein
MFKPLALILAGIVLTVLSACSFVTAAPATPLATDPALPTTLPTRVILQTDSASRVPRQETPAASAPLVAERGPAAVVWERSGGIAGLCQRLTVEYDGTYVLVDCRDEGTLSQGRLSKSALDQLTNWLNTYASLTWTMIPSAESADVFAVHYTFAGQGSVSPSAHEQEMINGYMAGLVRDLTGPRVTPSATARPGQTGIQGQVLIGPVCPVARAEAPCPDKPYQATITVLDQNHNPVTSLQSDAQGRFQVALAPGTYVLRPESPGAMPHAPEQTIVVTGNGYTAVTITYDSGIR